MIWRFTGLHIDVAVCHECTQNYYRFACWSIFYMSTIYRQCTNKYDNSISCSNDNTLKCLRSKINVYLQHNNNRSKCIQMIPLCVYNVAWKSLRAISEFFYPLEFAANVLSNYWYFSVFQKSSNVPNTSWRQVNDGKLSWQQIKTTTKF